MARTKAKIWQRARKSVIVNKRMLGQRPSADSLPPSRKLPQMASRTSTRADNTNENLHNGQPCECNMYSTVKWLGQRSFYPEATANTSADILNLKKVTMEVPAANQVNQTTKNTRVAFIQTSDAGTKRPMWLRFPSHSAFQTRYGLPLSGCQRRSLPALLAGAGGDQHPDLRQMQVCINNRGVI
jgi:hypothetical protein